MPDMAEPTTWTEALHAAIAEIVGSVSLVHDGIVSGALPGLRVQLDRFIDSLYGRPAGMRAAENRYVVVGAAAIVEARGSGNDVDLDRLVRLLPAKHADYGPANLLRFGRDGILVRLSDKVARIEQLSANGRAFVADEGIADAYRDVVGYCIQGIMLERGHYGLPFELPVDDAR